jgi:hypothetical protein
MQLHNMVENGTVVGETNRIQQTLSGHNALFLAASQQAVLLAC